MLDARNKSASPVDPVSVARKAHQASNSDPDDLAKARKRLFVVLLKRMKRLYFSRPVPERFYLGQDYVEDMHTVECMIGADFIFPGDILRGLAKQAPARGAAS
jgi:hypothetical protein